MDVSIRHWAFRPVAGALLCLILTAAHAEPLPSWRDSESRTRILSFVAAVTDPGSPDFVPPPERIAVFDNDGTLWSEQPFYFQLAFALDRVRAMAAEHPEWEHTQPFKAALEGDLEALIAAGKQGLLELLMTSHAGMTTEAFAAIVREWIASARHPRFDRPYTELVYQPMLELLAYLRANGFQTWIVSGGGIEFMRPWALDVYGVPPEQVIGSSIRTRFEWRDDEPVLARLPEVNFIDDKEGKPIAINQFIGRTPIAAFGNSDGDLQMLQWTTAGAGRRLGVIIRHTDAEREWAYDRASAVGRLDQALDQAAARGWVVVDMKKDWARVFAFESAE